MLYNKLIFDRCFCYPKRWWYKNLKNIPLYFKLIHKLIKYGYDEYATWETFNWFIYTMQSVLEVYKNTRNSSPNLEGLNIEESDKKWDEILNEMIRLLRIMDESNPIYSTDHYKGFEGMKKKGNEMNKAKDEFFRLFSTYFWNLWD